MNEDLIAFYAEESVTDDEMAPGGFDDDEIGSREDSRMEEIREAI